MRATRRAWILCLAAVIASVVWIATLPPAAELAPAVVSAGDAAAEAAAACAETAIERAARPVDPPRESDAPEDRIEVEAAAVARGPVVRVVESGTGRPQPEAEVFAIDSRVKRDGPGPWWEGVMRVATPVRADDRGTVVLPPVRGRVYLVARAERLFGAQVIDAAQRELTLCLEPDESLTARVTGAGGNAVSGLGVLLCADRDKKLRTLRALETDGSGEVRFEHVQLYRPQLGPKSSRESQAFVLLAAVPLFEPVMERVPAAAVPSRAVELRLGPTGALDARVLGPDRGTLQTACEIELVPTESSMAPGSSPWAKTVRAITRLRGTKDLGEPGVRFDTVGAGLAFDVKVTSPGCRFRQQNVSGPAAGETRVLELRVPSSYALVCGRLIGVDGQPCAGLATSMQVNGNAGLAQTRKVTTSAGGEFELALTVTQAPGSYALEVRRAGVEAPEGVLVALPTLVPGRRHDLGDVRLTALEPMAHGIVRDDRGHPVKGAKVSLWSFRPGRGQSGGWCQESPAASVVTDVDGGYRLFAERRPLRLRLQATASDHVTVESEDIGYGGRVDLTVQRMGSLVASGAFPPWLPRRSISYLLTRDGAKVRGRSVSARRDGGFRLKLGGLAPGVYRLAFSMRGLARPLAEIAGVVVRPGESSGDPRLTDVDLSRALYRYVVRPVGEGGERARTPSAPLLVRVVGSQGELEYVGFPWRGGQAEFYVPEPSVDAIVLSRGHRLLRTRLHAGESDLTLSRAAPVELWLPGLRELVGPDAKVTVQLTLEGDVGLPVTKLKTVDQKRGQKRSYSSSSMGGRCSAGLDGDDRARLMVMHDGRYSVTIQIGLPGARRTGAAQLGAVTVAVTADRAPAITLTPDAAAVRAALPR